MLLLNEIKFSLKLQHVVVVFSPTYSVLMFFCAGFYLGWECLYRLQARRDLVCVELGLSFHCFLPLHNPLSQNISPTSIELSLRNYKKILRKVKLTFEAQLTPPFCRRFLITSVVFGFRPGNFARNFSSSVT